MGQRDLRAEGMGVRDGKQEGPSWFEHGSQQGCGPLGVSWLPGTQFRGHSWARGAQVLLGGPGGQRLCTWSQCGCRARALLGEPELSGCPQPSCWFSLLLPRYLCLSP